MSALVFSAVLFSAFFQAGWNLVTKRSRANKIALLAVGWFLLGAVMVPVGFVLTPPSGIPPLGWAMMLASGTIQAFYLVLLGWAYTLGDISTVFPVARGLGIVVTTLLSLAFGLHGLSLNGGLGIFLVAAGALTIGLPEFAHHARRSAFLAALGVALTIGCYSVVDSIGVRHVPVFLYIGSMNLLAPLIAAPFLVRRLREPLRDILRFHKREAASVSGAGLIAYSIVLWAYQCTPTAYVAGLREFSIVIAAGLGALILREKIGSAKAAGIALILGGVVLIKFA